MKQIGIAALVLAGGFFIYWLGWSAGSAGDPAPGLVETAEAQENEGEVSPTKA